MTKRFGNIRHQWGLSGVRQIRRSVEEISTQLQNPHLSTFDRAFLQGRRRELLAAEWLLNQFFVAGEPLWQNHQPSITHPQKTAGELTNDSRFSFNELQPPTQTKREGEKNATHGPQNFPKMCANCAQKRTEIFESTFSKLNSNLSNQTETPLEIDILRIHKKRELLAIVLRGVEELLDEMLASDMAWSQIKQKRNTLVRDLWQFVIQEFFGKYYAVLLENSLVEVVPVLIADAEVVQTEIFEKIPLVENLFAYFLFDTLKIDSLNRSSPIASLSNMDIDEPLGAGHPRYLVSNINLGEPHPTKFRAEVLLENLTIQVANAVIQPLLNHFSESEEIKHEFFDRRWLSTRSILKFRNNLSWKYRLEKYFNEPAAIFESRYWLFIFDESGVKKMSIYAPRSQELAQLSGVPLVVTYVLESRDAVAPRLRSAVNFLGKFVVYLLTQVIGRGLGLIGRGILQGVGSSKAR